LSKIAQANNIVTLIADNSTRAFSNVMLIVSPQASIELFAISAPQQTSALHFTASGAVCALPYRQLRGWARAGLEP
jgi:hypothetical protein